MVAGPDIDTSGAWDLAVALAERCNLPVWASPAPGGAKLGFPEGHAQFRGVLPPAIGPAGETLAGHDFVLVVGTSVFPYYPYIPGPPLPEGTELVAVTSDPDEAARAPMGDAIVSDVRLMLEALLDEVAESDRPLPEPFGDPPPVEDSDPLSPSAVHATLGDVMPDDGIVVLESPSSTLALRNRLRISRPGSYFFCAGGGLGYGLAAGVGVQLAILKWFADIEQVTGAPGLDLPALDTAAVASAYGVNACTVNGRDELRDALSSAFASSGPELVEVPVTPGMALF
jgi:benzoylformate decarboxylase